LVAAKTDTDVEQVVFDYSAYLETHSKKYPLILWDIDNLRGLLNLNSSERTITLDVWCINEVEPEKDQDDKLEAWDEIEAELVAYIMQVDASYDISLATYDSIDYEYYPAGLLSLDREMAVKYTVTLKLWC